MTLCKHLILLLFILSLTACGGGSKSTTPPVETPPVETPPPSEPPPETPPSSVELPSYNTSPQAPDITGMESTAAELAGRMTIGLNIGNTLEAMGGKTETYWGNPEITREFVAFAKESGFNAIRLPVSWDQYADQETAEIEQAWLDRVKEVVQYCIDEDLYVIVNIHWDGGWLENNVTPAKQEENNAKQKAYWEQIATLLRDFDERLLFAGTNEPNVADAEEMDVLMSSHQTFIDAVRSTGGKNAYRSLIVQGPYTDIEQTHELMTTLPTDSVSERMMVELHFYSPWNFTLMEQDESWGNRFFYWGNGNHSDTDTAHNPTWGEEEYVDDMFDLMKVQFADQGIPIILGEYGAMVRDHLTGDDLQLHLESRAYYFYYVTQQAIATGMVPFYWDTGSLLDRSEYTVLDQLALDGLIDGANVHPPYWQDAE
ncbi:glycoside hydrolase family 5 protein [Marinimicrobium sp. ABcell2]|uniref:glycoside hydrolase family 5 protein n=1 Tax=Marinimicrobium sp. ABcell2 TaxID=3069751 RepID=UPI0027B6EA4A|nr:glycoside hydrolase family 5 protein [Marinimicrobium sp. ABcell2]MDQ2076769.1 glycoside hydrolase family 5 protein [Marinimicrobium sp. ABcell2]